MQLLASVINFLTLSAGMLFYSRRLDQSQIDILAWMTFVGMRHGGIWHHASAQSYVQASHALLLILY